MKKCRIFLLIMTVTLILGTGMGFAQYGNQVGAKQTQGDPISPRAKFQPPVTPDWGKQTGHPTDSGQSIDLQELEADSGNCLFEFPDESPILNMTLSPYKIVLNAELEGKSQDIQAVIRQPEVGASVDAFAVQFQVEKNDQFEFVCCADFFRYCAVDDNYLASFDRGEIQEKLEELFVGPAIVTVRVMGCYTIAADYYCFEAYDFLHVFDPGNKVR